MGIILRIVTRRTWIAAGIAFGTASVANHGPAGGQTAPADQSGVAPPRAVGQGGEPYRRDGGPSDTRVRVARDLLMLEGHVCIFDELFAAQEWDAARRRIDDATLELREKIEPYMKGQSVKPFTPLIAELLGRLEKHDTAGVRRMRSARQTRIGDAERAFCKYLIPYHQFALRALIESLKVAAKSYDAAVDGDAVVQAADYQDGRGIVVVAERKLAAILFDMRRIDSAAAELIATNLSAMKAAWPSVTPPTRIAVTPLDISNLVEIIDEAATPFWPQPRQ
jgi:hypothetical protein